MTTRTRVLAAGSLVLATAAAGGAYHFLGQVRRDLLDRLQAKAERNDRLLEAVAAGAEGDGGRGTLHAALAVLGTDPELVRVEIRGPDGTVVPSPAKPSGSPGEEFESRGVIKSGPLAPGEIRSTYTKAHVERRLREVRNRAALLTLLLCATLVAVNLLAAQGLSRPLLLAEMAQRREAERERARLVSILEATPDFVGIADPAGRALHVNRAGRAMTGIGTRPVAGLSIADFHPDWAAEVILKQGVPAAVKDGSWFGEAALLGPGGRETPVSVVVLSHQDAEGRLEYLSAIMRDISERLKSEATDRLLASIVRYSKDLIGMADIEGRLQFLNQSGRVLIGAGPEEDLAGVKVEDLIHPSSHSLLATEVLPSIRQHGHWSGQIQFRHRVSGEPVPVESEGFRIDDATGRPIYMASVSRDVRESQRAQLALTTSEERMRQAVRVAQLGIYDHDHAAGTLYWSPSQRELFGVEADEPVSLQFYLDRLHPDDRERVGEAVGRAHDPAGDGTFDIDYRIVKRSGEVRWLSNRGQTFFEGEGAARRPVRSVGAVLDITERRAAEEERAALQVQLAHAQRLETVGRLAGGVAHDFNNTLHVILGFAELLRSKLLPGEGPAAQLAEIQRAARHARDLTRQLLGFSRRQVISPALVDLNQVIADTMGSLARLIGEDVELRVVTDESLFAVNADRAQIDQVLMNLVVNSRDAMPNGGKLLIETANAHFDEAYCRQHVGVQPGPYALIAVSDSGVGMDKETIAHIFEPFFTTKELGKGTGLGLATVYGIVEQNGGFINVYSEPGRGATFKVYFPRAIGPGEATGQPDAAAAAGGSANILVVEDEEAVRRLTVALVESIGYNVFAAARPEEALARCLRGEPPIDLVLTDVVMPGMSGKDLRDRLAQLAPGVKVVFTSGYTANVIAHHGILDPGVHFIAKPFGVTELARKLREVLARP